ncbi:MAG: antibiotic biosynthesis monooxygenase [Desulfobulbaceae bacterium]|jgi:quinol monooxygenase YgiN|nr:antibiotic biosynthesis monooxygenase [Desulfobulbaceae bacterium]
MILLRTIIIVLPEKQKEVFQTLLSLIEPHGKTKGCLSYEIFNDIEDGKVFNLISAWETRLHLDTHIKSAKFTVLLGIRSLLCEPLKIQIITTAAVEGMEVVRSVRKK